MSERTPQQIGRANRRAGKDAQLAGAAKARTLGYPNAAYEVRNGSSDIIGTGDLAIEVTTTGWDKIWIKLDQAARDAKRRGLDAYCVWKKRNGKTDMGEGAIIIPAKLFLPMMADLDAYRRTEMDAQLQFERGYRLGREAREDTA